MNQFIIGSITSIISFVLGLVGHIVYGKYQEKHQRQNESLNNHFESLRLTIIEPIINLLWQITCSQGVLYIYDEKAQLYSNPKYSWQLKLFESEDFLNFKFHFPNQADNVEKLMNYVIKSNDDNRLFNKKLEKCIQEKTNMPIRNIQTIEDIQEERPFIYAEVPTYLQQALYYLPQMNMEQKTVKRTFNFKQSEIKKEADNYYRLHGGGAAYAQLPSEQEAILCKEILVELMESEELQEEAYTLFNEAKRLENESRNIVRTLESICQHYSKYGKFLKRKKNCTICQVIFE